MEQSSSGQAGRAGYAGLFFTALATIMYEVLLTRIFSVTMWYHFAFMAISIAMFGMTVGAILVYLMPGFFKPERTNSHLALSAWWFTVFVILSFLTYLLIPFGFSGVKNSVLGFYAGVFTYVVIAVPFVFSGVCVCLALTRFPKQVSRLYAADLAGAALGCVLVIYALEWTDGPTAVLLVTGLAALGALCFSGASSLRMKVASALLFGALAVAGIGHAGMVREGRPLLKLLWVKGELDAPSLLERWNAFSRITVRGDPKHPTKPTGWGLSDQYDGGKVPQLQLSIDAAAGTKLTGFNGDAEEVEFLKYDVTNVAHYLRQDADVLVVGVGGGRDVLSALAFDQKSVKGVELNDNILEALTGEFSEFTGNLGQDPRVTFVNDEARSYIERDSVRYDILMISLIDTWAATSAGAFVLAENSLYTVESWRTFLTSLTDRGVLTVSRWYFKDNPGEVYRLAALAAGGLEAAGIENPRQHIMIVRNMQDTRGKRVPNGIGTILVSRSPFSDADVERMRGVTQQLNFEMVLSPKDSMDETFDRITSGEDLAGFTANFPIDISPPTDDRPFFFNMLRLTDILHRDRWKQGYMSFNMLAVVILGLLLLIMMVLTSACIVVPLILTTRREILRGALPLFLFFTAIGFGFMLVEISQMQRLVVFLGHPVYGLSVVLFAILLSSGIGSFLTQPMQRPGPGLCFLIGLALIGTLVAFGYLTPLAITRFASGSTPLRIGVAVGILFPLGLVLGTAFPVGMKLASGHSPQLTPWLWGINGATSVCASVLAMALALHYGISRSFWIGVGCYVVAWLMMTVQAFRSRAIGESTNA